MRPQLQELYNNFFGQDVFIVGGGYSIKSVNLNYLLDKKVIAINTAFEYLPNATALLWSDSSWLGINNNLNKLTDHKCKLRFNPKKHGQGHIQKNILTSGGATVLLATGDYGFDPNIDNVRGNNSGVQALNLAINMKPKRIFLIGFDMRSNPLKPAETHFHDKHQLVVRPNTYANLFIPSMVSLATEIKKLNINTEIINCSPTSALACFEKRLIKELQL